MAQYSAIGFTGEHTAVQVYGWVHSQHVGKRLETPGGQRQLWLCRPIYLQFVRQTYYICMLAKCTNAPVSPQAQFWDRRGPRAKPRIVGHCNGPRAIVMALCHSRH